MAKTLPQQITKTQSSSWHRQPQYSKNTSFGVSMLPLFGPNSSLEIVKEKQYQVDDIVIFKKRNKLIAHRLIYIPRSHNFFITKGDNNLRSDGKISPDMILGKVTNVTCKNKKSKIESLYLTQSLLYIHYIDRFTNFLNKNNIPFIILKGLPIHLRYEGKIPNRIYFDVDFLIKEDDLRVINKFLKTKGFIKTKDEKNKKVNAVQHTYINTDRAFGINFDIHISPVRIYRKLNLLNIFVPDKGMISKMLWEGSEKFKISGKQYTVLNKETQIVYLLLHFFQHNMEGIHRLGFINNIVTKGPRPNWNKIAKMVKRYYLFSLCYPPLKMLEIYYDFCAPRKFYSFFTNYGYVRIVGSLLSRISNPFNSNGKYLSLIKRILYSVTCSPIFYR